MDKAKIKLHIYLAEINPKGSNSLVKHLVPEYFMLISVECVNAGLIVVTTLRTTYSPRCKSCITGPVFRP